MFKNIFYTYYEYRYKDNYIYILMYFFMWISVKKMCKKKRLLRKKTVFK